MMIRSTMYLLSIIIVLMTKTTTTTTLMMVKALVSSSRVQVVVKDKICRSCCEKRMYSSSLGSMMMTKKSISSSSGTSDDLSSTFPVFSSGKDKQRKESNKNKNENNQRKEQERNQKLRNNDNSNSINNKNNERNAKRNNDKKTTTTTTTTIRKLPETIPILSDILEGRFTFNYDDDNQIMVESKLNSDGGNTKILEPEPETTITTVATRSTKNDEYENNDDDNINISSSISTTVKGTIKNIGSATTVKGKMKDKSEAKRKESAVKVTVDNKKSSSMLTMTPSSSSSRKVKKIALPWRAGYHASKRTQGRIKQVFTNNDNDDYSSSTSSSSQRSRHHHSRAQRVLDELLRTPPQYCNAVNLVCALTYSAKALGGNHYHRHNHKDNNKVDLNLRKSLQKTFDILHNLLVIHREDKLFTSRQLCNVCWAIAKHYDRDPELLMPQNSKNEEVWEWDHLLDQANVVDGIENEDGNINNTKELADSKNSRLRLEENIDEIASQLTMILFEEEESGDDDHELNKKNTFQQPKIKLGEICMACWAYGKLRPREIPPGWAEPPKMGRVTTTSMTPDSSSASVIKFEQLGSKGSFSKGMDKTNSTNNNSNKIDISVTDILFDAMGYALCQSLNKKHEDLHHDDYDMHPILLLEDCTWKELANIGWAFASHGRCRSTESEMLLKSLAEVASNRLREDDTKANNNNKNNQNFLVRDISQLLWSLGTLQADNFRLADGLVLLVESLTMNLSLGVKTGSRFVQGRPLRSWSCADLVQTAVALAHARIDEKLLLRAIYEESIHRLMEGSSSSRRSPSFLTSSLKKVSSIDRLFGEDRRTFHPWEASILLWAQARLYLTEQEGVEFDEFTEDAPLFFLKALHEKRGSFIESRIGPQEQANIVWSLVILEKYHSPEAIILIDLIFQEASRSCKENQSIQLEHAHQLWQAYFMLEEDCPEALKRVPDWFVSYLKGKWSLEKARDKISSARHQSLSSTLQLMGVDHINEHDEDIDVAIILQPNAVWVHQTDMDDEMSDLGIDEENHISVAVEFDGPNHFTRVCNNSNENSPFRPETPRALGHTVLKYRLLKKQGWTVVRVPYYEFDKIPFWASMERQRYLQRKLKTHANIEFSEVDVSEYKQLTPNRKSRFD